MARDSTTTITATITTTSSSVSLTTCVAMTQWIVLIVVTSVKRGVRFFCRARGASSSVSSSVECIDLEAGGIVHAPEAICNVGENTEQDEATEAFETIDVLVIADMQQSGDDGDDSCERIEIVVVSESAGASKPCANEEDEDEGEEEEAVESATNVDAIMAVSKSKGESGDEDAVDENENDWTPTHSTWDSEDDDPAADTQLDFDLDTVSDAASCSSPASLQSTSDDDQGCQAPLMADSKHVHDVEKKASRHQDQQEQNVDETNSSDDDESKSTVNQDDAELQEKDEDDSELDTVTDSSSASPLYSVSSGSDYEIEDDDNEEESTSTSSTISEPDAAQALCHQHQPNPEPEAEREQESVETNPEEDDDGETALSPRSHGVDDSSEDQRARTEPTANVARTTISTATARTIPSLESYHAITIRVDNREHNRRLRQALPKALRYSDSLEYKQMRAASLARQVALRKAAAKPRFQF